MRWRATSAWHYCQRRIPYVGGNVGFYDIAPDAPDTSGRTVPAVGPDRNCSPSHQMYHIVFQVLG